MNGFTGPTEGDHGVDLPDGPIRSLLALGDEETGAMTEMLMAAADHHGARIEATVYFDRDDLVACPFTIEHPALIDALTTAARVGLGVWLPFPADLGSEVEFLGFVSVAAHLGVPLYTGRCITPWNEQVLPGLATSDTVAVAAVAWRRFLAKAGGELLVTSLCTAIAQSGRAA